MANATPPLKTRTTRALSKDTRLELPPAPHIRYTRKSTEEDDRQIASHEQQLRALDGKWGPTNTGLHFQDSASGTTFERPGFQEMLAFCEHHPQPKTEPGVVEMYDMSRFGRILTNGEEDPEAVLTMMKTFLRHGWEIRFVTFETTGNRVMDFFQNGLYAIMASEVSKKLQRDVRRGLQHFLTLDDGARWLGGRAPFGTVRIDPTTKKPLDRWERALARGGTVLAPNPEELALWREAASMLLKGKTYAEIVDYLNAKRARVEWGQRWNAKGVKWVLTNPALVGERHVNHTDPKTGQVTKRVYKAAWEPMVDEATFLAVGAEVARRIGDGHRRHRSHRNRFVPTCAHCGCPYYYQERNDKRKKNGKTQRFFQHPDGKSGISQEWKDRIRAAGCHGWSVSATIVEAALRDLIVERRSSEDFALHLSEVIAERGDLEGSAERQRKAAESRLREIEAAQRRTVANMAKAQEKGLDDAIFWQQLADLNRQIEEAKREKTAALELEAVANAAWDDIQALIDETRNLKAIWDAGDSEKRQEILHWWVQELLIVVDKQPVRVNGRPDPKYMVAFLRTAPTEGLERALTRQAAPLKLESTDRGTPQLQRLVPPHQAFVAPLLGRYHKPQWLPAGSSAVAQMLRSTSFAPVAPEPRRRRGPSLLMAGYGIS